MITPGIESTYPTKIKNGETLDGLVSGRTQRL